MKPRTSDVTDYHNHYHQSAAVTRLTWGNYLARRR
jgi:hypothetical protein